MRCDTVRAALLDYSNAETGPVRAWAIRRHLAACAGCAQELAALRQFTATLRRADLVPPLSAPVTVPARRMPLRRALAAAAAFLLVVGLFLLPTLYQSRRNAQNPGAAIAAALGRVNTWHFSGWKLIDGKQVAWDVWGRRKPFLYYERVGDMTTWADDKQRVRVFAPNAALNRPHGLVIRTTADQTYFDLGFSEDPAYQSLVGDGRARTDFGDGITSLYQQTLTTARFRRQYPLGVSSGVNANKLYTISKRDWLPTGYQLHYDGAKLARDTEALDAWYDSDLPNAVLQPPPADGYGVVDFTPSAKHVYGFKVDVQPVGMDTSGNVVIVARGWLGGNRLTPGSTFSLNVQPYNGIVSGERRGRTIKYLYATNSSLPPGSDIYMPFAALEPSQVAHALPDTFWLSLSASPQVQVRSSDLIFADGSTHPVTSNEDLINQMFQWRMRLPKPVSDLAAALPPDARSLFHSLNERELYGRRRFYYSSSSDFQAEFYEKVLPEAALRKFRRADGSLDYYRVNGGLPPQQLDALQHEHAAEYKILEQGFRRRAIYWQKRAIAELKGKQDLPAYQSNVPINFLRRDDTLLLAKLYRDGGNKVGMRRTLRQLIADTQADPSLGELHRQAEYMLRTGQYPGDAGYKGPA